MKIRSICILCLVTFMSFFAVYFYISQDKGPQLRFWAHQRGQHGQVVSMVFSPDGKMLVAGDREKSTLWNINPLKKLESFPGGSPVLSPNGKILATIVDDIPSQCLACFVNLWEIDTGKELASLNNAGIISSMAYSPRGDLLACALLRSKDGEIGEAAYIWDTKTAKRNSILMDKRAFYAIAFSPDGTTLATGGDDNMVKLWNVATAQENMTLGRHQEPVLSVCFSPDGKTLATTSEPGTVKLWNLKAGKELFTIETHDPGEAAVCVVAFEPKGSLLATGDRKDGTINLWDVATGEKRLVLRKRGQHDCFGVHSIAFSPDGKTLAAGVKVGQVELWNVPELPMVSPNPAKTGSK